MTERVVREELGELLSPSQVNTYLTCPAKWYFRYLLGSTEPPTGALALGKAFHAALATNFRHKLACGRNMEPAEAREVFEQEWIVASHDAQLRDDEDTAELTATGEALVHAYISEAPVTLNRAPSSNRSRVRLPTSKYGLSLTCWTSTVV